MWPILHRWQHNHCCLCVEKEVKATGLFTRNYNAVQQAMTKSCLCGHESVIFGVGWTLIKSIACLMICWTSTLRSCLETAEVERANSFHANRIWILIWDDQIQFYAASLLSVISTFLVLQSQVSFILPLRAPSSPLPRQQILDVMRTDLAYVWGGGNAFVICTIAFDLYRNKQFTIIPTTCYLQRLQFHSIESVASRHLEAMWRKSWDFRPDVKEKTH